jgi:DNA-directed RNA polymerase II subunit RPB9
LEKLNLTTRSANLLYPKEDPASRTLSFVCKACHHVEEAEPSCTFRKELGNSVTETAGVTTDVANDPTVSRYTRHRWVATNET